MKIGFVQPEEEIVDEQEVGFIDPASGAEGEQTDWPSWVATVLIHFCMVYGIIAIVRDVIDFFSR